MVALGEGWNARKRGKTKAKDLATPGNLGVELEIRSPRETYDEEPGDPWEPKGRTGISETRLGLRREPSTPEPKETSGGGSLGRRDE